MIRHMEWFPPEFLLTERYKFTMGMNRQTVHCFSPHIHKVIKLRDQEPGAFSF